MLRCGSPRLGERESNIARLQEAVAAYRAALEGRMRERMPREWADTQRNLGYALLRLGARESGTATLTEAIAALDACLTVTAPVGPPDRVNQLRALKKRAQVEIKRRTTNKLPSA